MKLYVVLLREKYTLETIIYNNHTDPMNHSHPKFPIPKQSFKKKNYRVLTMKLEMLCSSDIPKQEKNYRIHLLKFENKVKNYKIHHLKFEISRTTLQNPSTEVQKQEKSKRKYETNQTEGLKKP